MERDSHRAVRRADVRSHIVVVCVLWVGATGLEAQRVWQVDRLCEFSMGEPGAWDGGALESADILFADGLFHMFYAGSDNGGQRSGHQLGYAWSDDGCNWVRHPLNPILGNLLSWESAGVLNPTVVRDDQEYKLWYGGWSTTSCGIGLATSEDPFLFERFSAEPNIGPGVADGLTCVFDPVVHWDGSLYRMWYTGSGSDRFAPKELRFATSADGQVWEDYALNPVFREATRSPSIVYHEDSSTYEMWYGTGGISYATSMDGLSWGAAGSVNIVGENDNHGNGTVLLIGDTYHMWYTATTSFIAWPYIRHATSEWTLPRASFAARAESTPAGVGVMGTVPLTVDFDATNSVSPAAGGITEYTWDFGNGSKGTGAETRNVFTHGAYQVRLVVKDAAGNSGQGTRSVVALQDASPLPPWIASDVGTVSFGGAVRELDGCWEAAEAWGFIGLNTDDFHYVYQEVTGDFLIEVEVTVPTPAPRNSRLGLMARMSLDSEAPMIYHHIRGGRVRGTRRESAGVLAKTDVLYRLGEGETVVGLRFQRSGDVFTGFYTLDGGTTWVADTPQVASEFPPTIPVGIALSGSPSNLLSTWRVCKAQLRHEAGMTTPFVRGDANGDRVRDLTDGVFVLDYLFQQQAVPSCLKAADADDNGRLDLTDAVSLLNFLFLGGAPLAAPSETCGEDPTGDDLACDDFQGCP